LCLKGESSGDPATGRPPGRSDLAAEQAVDDALGAPLPAAEGRASGPGLRPKASPPPSGGFGSGFRAPGTLKSIYMTSGREGPRGNIKKCPNLAHCRQELRPRLLRVCGGWKNQNMLACLFGCLLPCLRVCLPAYILTSLLTYACMSRIANLLTCLLLLAKGLTD